MKISTPKSLASRLIMGGTVGVLIALGMFSVLLHLIDDPVEFRPAVKMVRPDIRDVRVPPTVVKPPPPVKIDKPPVPEVPTTRTLMEEPISQRGEIGPPGKFSIDFSGPPRGPTLPGRFMSGGTDQDAIPRVRIPPAYPARAEIRGIEGWVRVQFTITETGSVKDAHVVAADPARVFDDAALSAIARWRYNPRVVNGEPVERVGMQTMIEFTLNE
jgi:protein TonB